MIVGNHRCNLSGVDLNRKYKTPSAALHPTIFHLKEMIAQFMRDRPIVLSCDMHGHSHKHNVFMYGCNNYDDPSLMFKVRCWSGVLDCDLPSL